MKTTTSITLDADVLYAAKASNINISAEINTFLKERLQVLTEKEDHFKKKKELEKELIELLAKANHKQALIKKIKEEEIAIKPLAEYDLSKNETTNFATRSKTYIKHV